MIEDRDRLRKRGRLKYIDGSIQEYLSSPNTENNRSFTWVMAGPAGRVRRFSKSRGMGRVESGQVGNLTGRVGSGRVGSGRIGSAGFQISRVELDHPCLTRPCEERPDP